MLRKLMNGMVLLLLTTSLLAVGCSDDLTTSIEDEATASLSSVEYLDETSVAVVEAWAVEEEEDAPMEVDLGVVDVLHAVHLPNVNFLLSGAMVDTTIETPWFTHTIDWTFYDADGVASEEFSEATVSADVEHTSEGVRTSPRGNHTKTFSRSASLSYDGFDAASTALTVNGSGSAVQTDTMSGARFDMTMTATGEGTVEWSIADLQIAKDLESLPWPLAGTITSEMNRTRTISSATLDTTVTQSIAYIVTFDGSEYATVLFGDGTEIVIDLTQLPDPGLYGGCTGEPEDYGHRRERIRGPRR